MKFLSASVVIALVRGDDGEDVACLLQTGLAQTASKTASVVRRHQQASHGCQKVLDQCTGSQKIPLVGNLITETFKDCTQTFGGLQGLYGQSLIQFEDPDVAQCEALSEEVHSTWIQELQVEESMLKSLSPDLRDSGEYFLADAEKVVQLETMHTQFGQHISLASCRQGDEFFETIVAEARSLGLKTKADLMVICDEAKRDSGKCITTSGKEKEVWKSSETEDMLLKSRAVCNCLAPTLIQRMGDAISGHADQLQDISGFASRSAGAFDEFTEKFGWLPKSLLQTMRKYNDDRHSWAEMMSMSAKNMKGCGESSGLSLLQQMSSTKACLHQGLVAASVAAQKAGEDAKQMSEIVAAFSKYVPLCGAFMQFAETSPHIYGDFNAAVQSALEEVGPKIALLQSESSQTEGQLVQLELSRINAALGKLHQGLQNLRSRK